MERFLVALVAAVILLVFLQAAFPALAQTDTTTPVTGEQALAASAAQAQSPCGTSYTVVYGDTLGGIAVRCQVSYSALVAANPQITNVNLIFPGQVIAIPSTTPIPPTGGQIYTVVAGDTLSEIAVRFGTTVAAIQAANPSITNVNLIFPGQRITIPTGGSIPPTGGQTYTVRTGDTLSSIAQRFGTTVAALQAANPFITNVNRIYPGQVLRIP